METKTNSGFADKQQAHLLRDVETSTLSLSVSSAEDRVKTFTNPTTFMDCQDADSGTNERFDELIREWLATLPRHDRMTSSRCEEFIVLCCLCNLG